MLSIKLIGSISIAAVLAIGSYAGWTLLQLQRAEAKVVQAESARAQAIESMNRAIEANRVNQDTIDQLVLEKAAIEKSLSQLEADRRRNQQLINNLSASIRAMATDPANQVELRPVLKQTIDTIQRKRQERNPR
jgi:chromosome segregation ATPase